jgi:hypothetical protein
MFSSASLRLHYGCEGHVGGRTPPRLFVARSMARLNHLMVCLVTSASVTDFVIEFFLTAPEIRQICLCLWYVAFKAK